MNFPAGKLGVVEPQAASTIDMARTANTNTFFIFLLFL
jgi:hypothetical protein